MSKEPRVRALENKQYVNGPPDKGASADCRLIMYKVRDFFLEHICRSLYTVCM